jgi:hypothetical protein
MFYHNVASDLTWSNLFSDAKYAKPVYESVPQLIEIHRELLEDYSGV